MLPIHEASQVRKLYHSWCLAPFSFYPFQPLDDIRDYFGPKVSFYFAFVGHLARSLLLPAIVDAQRLDHHGRGCATRWKVPRHHSSNVAAELMGPPRFLCVPIYFFEGT